MKVITADAYTLGEIDGAHVNIDNWKITNLELLEEKRVEPYTQPDTSSPQAG